MSPQKSGSVNFEFKEVTTTEVFKYLKRLKRKCATGLDNVPACFLKDTAYSLAKPLTHIINLSLQTELFPTELKKARVTPIFKSGDKTLIDNYRPISILPIVSKIFEKCAQRQIMNHLEENNLLSEYQFGFGKTDQLKSHQLCLPTKYEKQWIKVYIRVQYI